MYQCPVIPKLRAVLTQRGVTQTKVLQVHDSDPPCGVAVLAGACAGVACAGVACSAVVATVIARMGQLHQIGPLAWPLACRGAGICQDLWWLGFAPCAMH